SNCAIPIDYDRWKAGEFHQASTMETFRASPGKSWSGCFGFSPTAWAKPPEYPASLPQLFLS
ncbi:uncharacterized protein METZ01_LOCUS507177, partial [marine metagenome]